MISTIVGNKFVIDSILGCGNFGIVYDGLKLNSLKEHVAIKLEPIDNTYKVLRHEVTILNYLHYNGVKYIPRIYWFGQHLNYTCLVMTHFTCSLQDYIIRKGILNQIKLSSMIIKCIDLLSSVHKSRVLHRDIKPHNFMIKDGDLYLIDFGLSNVFIDDYGEHTEKRDIDSIVGSPKYVSYYNHCSEPMSRRDDLISLGYMYMFMQKGQLPWDNTRRESPISDISVLNPNNIFRMDKKSWIKIESILDGAIKMYMKYCYELKYNDEPNYHILMELFVNF
jgi:serine/threonine protein kinase